MQVVYSTISCRGLCLNYWLKKISQTLWSSANSIFYNKLSWFVSELLAEKDISNVVVQCK